MALFLKTELNSWAVLSYFLEKRKCTYKLNMTEQNLLYFQSLYVADQIRSGCKPSDFVNIVLLPRCPLSFFSLFSWNLFIGNPYFFFSCYAGRWDTFDTLFCEIYPHPFKNRGKMNN